MAGEQVRNRRCIARQCARCRRRSMGIFLDLTGGSRSDLYESGHTQGRYNTTQIYGCELLGCG